MAMHFLFRSQFTISQKVVLFSERWSECGTNVTNWETKTDRKPCWFWVWNVQWFHLFISMSLVYGIQSCLLLHTETHVCICFERNFKSERSFNFLVFFCTSTVCVRNFFHSVVSFNFPLNALAFLSEYLKIKRARVFC